MRNPNGRMMAGVQGRISPDFTITSVLNRLNTYDRCLAWLAGYDFSKISGILFLAGSWPCGFCEENDS